MTVHSSRHHNGVIATALCFVAALLVGCTGVPVDTPVGEPEVSIRNLPPLGGDYYYELWLGEPKDATDHKTPRPDHGNAKYYSIGRFQVTPSGDVIARGGGTPSFSIPEGRNRNILLEAIVTMQLPADTNVGLHLLGGIFTGTDNVAIDTLTLTGATGFDERILPDEGTFILDAPSANDSLPLTRGIWFVNINRDGTGAPIDTLPGLPLPVLPNSGHLTIWNYMGWVVRTNGGITEYIRLGEFKNPNASDYDGAGYSAGPGGSGYGMPGGDFIRDAGRDLGDGTYGAMISLEPRGFTFDEPFLPILVRTLIPAGTAAHQSLNIPCIPDPPVVTIRIAR